MSSDKSSPLPPLIRWPKAAKTFDSVSSSPGAARHARPSATSFTLRLQNARGWRMEVRPEGGKGKGGRQYKLWVPCKGFAASEAHWPGGEGMTFPKGIKALPWRASPRTKGRLLLCFVLGLDCLEMRLIPPAPMAQKCITNTPPRPLSPFPQASPIAAEPHPGLVQHAVRIVLLKIPPPFLNGRPSAGRTARLNVLPRSPLLVRDQHPSVRRSCVRRTALGRNFVVVFRKYQPLANALELRGCPTGGRSSPLAGSGKSSGVRRRRGFVANRLAGLEVE